MGSMKARSLARSMQSPPRRSASSGTASKSLFRNDRRCCHTSAGRAEARGYRQKDLAVLPHVRGLRKTTDRVDLAPVVMMALAVVSVEERQPHLMRSRIPADPPLRPMPW